MGDRVSEESVSDLAGELFMLEREQYLSMLVYCITGWSRSIEACGLLIRGVGPDVVHTIDALNVADEPEHEFVVDPYTLHDNISMGRTLVGTYHSHNTTEAVPSELDVACWIALHRSMDGGSGSMRHLIVSMVSGQPVTSCWRVEGMDGTAADCRIRPVTFAIGT